MSVPRSPDFKASEERPMLRFDSEVMDFRVVSESCSVTGSLMNKHATASMTASADLGSSLLPNCRARTGVGKG